MSSNTRHDTWQAGDSYDAYMGRWSRPIATRFLDLLSLPASLDWLELGCGTGALTAAIVRQCDPASVIALDPSQDFIAASTENVRDARVEFRTGGADSLGSMPAASRDVAVSGLVLNFVPDPVAALRDMKRIVRPGGTIAYYVWDYPGGGLEFLRAFWTAAVALDPGARDLAEDRRFPFCTPEGLLSLAARAGLDAPQITPLEAPSVFADFDDFWHPFTLGAGAAPGYCASLPADARQRLRASLHATLPRQEDGTIALATRAWAVSARVL